jgi:hypothetical protein
MAHKKGQGSSRNGRDSNPNFRGVKLFAGQAAKAGSTQWEGTTPSSLPPMVKLNSREEKYTSSDKQPKLLTKKGW